MRVIAGENRGIQLLTPSDNKIRPTMDRAKEGLFNVINAEIIDSNFLDLFAGTGNIAIEAKSRGANQVVAVDNNVQSINLIKSNVEKVSQDIDVILSDAKKYLKHCNLKFDYIFLDPPYDITTEDVNEIINIVYENGILENNGKIIIECDKKRDFEIDNIYKEKRYGISKFLFIKED